ncbi:hypothetical protein [Streptomyces sp. AC602_WCS936]|uniref:hypothetical protein n=1 Tax=Streptomyces sp. AC602_WCS936 TaxID=2823685 RepID=UPI001C27DC41|nr:hypothetical protein [Streptomyces sp. AC602_WCS936]
MNVVLRWSGVGKAVSFYRYFAFDLPVFTTLSALVFLLGFAFVQLWILVTHQAVPVYFTVYLALLTTGSVLAMTGITLGWATREGGLRRAGRLAWALGSAVSLVSIGMYLFSRTAGLPGLGELAGRWDYIPGTLSMALAGLFAGLHFSVLTGLNVAAPDRRGWDD